MLKIYIPGGAGIINQRVLDREINPTILLLCIDENENDRWFIWILFLSTVG